VLLVNVLAALNFANVFLNKNAWKIKKNVNKRKKRDQHKKRKKRFFTSMRFTAFDIIWNVSFQTDNPQRYD